MSPLVATSRGVARNALTRCLPTNYRPSRIGTRHYHLPLRPEPLRLPAGHQSLLPLVHTCNNLVLRPNPTQPNRILVGTRTADGTVVNDEDVVPFVLSSNTGSKSSLNPLGYLRPTVVEALLEDHQLHEKQGKKSPWDVLYDQNRSGQPFAVSFASWVNEGGKAARTMQMERVIQDWKRGKYFEDILRGWSNETYAIFDHPPEGMNPHRDPVAFGIERAALPLFGFPNFGTLLIGYFQDLRTNKTMIWVPRRALTKRTWPGKLDVTVGGGMGLGDAALSTIVREAAEEASLDPRDISPYIHPVGILPFPNRSPANWILPGLYYLFDLPLPSDGSIRPRTNVEDGEVDTFELMDTETVLHELLAGKFKSSSAMAMVSFLIRHGFVTEETDVRFGEVCKSLNKSVDLPIPWR